MFYLADSTRFAFIGNSCSQPLVAIIKQYSMDKLFTVILLLNISIALGQSKLETYRFSKDILSQIDKDTVAWKYQIGATELSFSGYYREVLQVWDKNGVRKPKITVEDS